MVNIETCRKLGKEKVKDLTKLANYTGVNPIKLERFFNNEIDLDMADVELIYMRIKSGIR